MKVTDPHFRVDKIRKYLNEDIKPTRYRNILDIAQWKYCESDMITEDSLWRDFHIGESWGGYNKTAWFKTSVEVPPQWEELPIMLKCLIGPHAEGESTAEALLYVNNTPVQGFDLWHDEAFLDASLYSGHGGTMEITIKSWSGTINPPKVRTFALAQLIQIDPWVDKFYHVIDTLVQSIELLDQDDLRRIRLVQILNTSFQYVNFLAYKEDAYYHSIREALDYVLLQLEELATYQELKPVITAVGHSHIDMAWLWPLCATREKASRTFSTVLNLMRQYPEYKYLHTSPQLYKFLEQDYPTIFQSVREKIADGQWEITGGMWVESDTNIPSGESLVRQFLYGIQYIKQVFQKDSKVVWLPDVFGYTGALPQIIKKSGMEYFMTTKISWNQYNHFPYDTFMWKGIDGTEILTHFITTPEDGSWYYTYNGQMLPEEITGIWKNYKNKEQNNELLLAFGWGDGGGGPTREMLERRRVLENLPGIPSVQIDTTEHYFKRLAERVDIDTLDRWSGELYFEYHRGTYTSQAFIKRENRKAEILLHDVESLSVISEILCAYAYPKKNIQNIWERVLLNQFHDILPGSSIKKVYDDCRSDYAWINRSGEKLLMNAIDTIVSHMDVSTDSVVLYNTLGWQRNDVVCMPFSNMVQKDITCFLDNGKILPTQTTEEGLLVFVENIPAYGYKTIQIASQTAKNRSDISVTEDLIENAYYVIRLNDQGEITSLFDKHQKRELAAEEPLNVFVAYEDKPLRFDAWDIDAFYKEKPYPSVKLLERRVVECGSLRGVLRLTWEFHRSKIHQDIIVFKDIERIDFKTHIEWKERQVLLKVLFPVDIHAPQATYEIQFGNIARNTHTNTEQDFAQFEVSGHKWVDLSDGNYGVSLLNDCKYGYHIKESVIGLTLIKSAIRPDPTADRGDHYVTYSLYPHKGGWRDSNVQYLATQLNSPVHTTELKQILSAKDDYLNWGLVDFGNDHVILDTIKKAESEDAYIVRLFEYKNMPENRIQLTFNMPVRKVVETNLVEEYIHDVELYNSDICFSIGCYEIKTFKVYVR